MHINRKFPIIEVVFTTNYPCIGKYADEVWGVKLTVAYSRAEPQIPYNLDDVKQKVNSIWKDWKNESDNIPAAGSKSEKEKYLKEVLGYLTQEGNGLSRRHISEIKSDEYLEEVYDEDR